MNRDPFDSFETVSSFTVDQAVDDGVLLDLASGPSQIQPLAELTSLDGYLKNYGRILGKKAITALEPLHVPGRDPLPDFDDLLREPFEPQKHVVAAAIQMMDAVGSGFLCGEMGVGKTMLGMVSVFKHAQRSRNQGGHSGKFRCIVLCPDHLIAKWAREIGETIPGAVTHRFEQWTEIARFLDPENGGRWAPPQGPEYYVIGRNQAKWYPDWLGISDPQKGFDGTLRQSALSSKHVVVDRVPKLDQEGRPLHDRRGQAVMTNVTARVHYCPQCGTVARDKKGVPLAAKHLSDKQQTCTGLYLEQVVAPEQKQNGRDRLSPIPSPHRDRQVGQEVQHAGKSWIVRECREPLWNWTSQPYRWAPARIIHKKLRRFFDYLLIDEVHEQKSDESAQSMACGKLIASVQHTLALTGTIIGGYANHLYPLMMRLTPTTLRDEGFAWGKDLAFTEIYGRIDRVITTREEGVTTSVAKNVKSMRRARSGGSSERKAVRPGVMPTLFGRHLIGSSMFLTLGELAAELPDLFEYTGGPLLPSGDADRDARAQAGWVDVACDMLPDQKAEYDRVTQTLEAVNRELLRKGSMKLLGAYLWTALDYPDRPWGWDHDKEVVKALEGARAEVARENGSADAARLRLGHTVGYWDKPGLRTLANFVGVVTPRSLSEAVVYPKERTLVDICKKQKSQGIQTWVYVHMTGKRNIQPRLKALLEREGLKVGILRSGDVDPKEREEWIAHHGREFDVMISHPQLVSTGLDLFSKAEGGHNYATIVFYETGYNLFTMRQAARRAWRIGQPRDCRVYYLYYKDSMQHRAMQLMSRKMAAAQALEGEFSEDGLAAMAGEDNLQMALARSLSDRIDQADMQRSWTKVAGGPKSVRPVLQRIGEALCDGHPGPIFAATETPLLKLVTVESSDRPDTGFELPDFGEELLLKMFANLAANGMTLEDLAG
jgi:hypothetical protein